MKKINVIILFFIVSSLSSCNKWKEPTDVDFFVDINKTPTLNDKITFTGGEIILESFDFDAQRDKGEDVIFTQNFTNGLAIPFNINQIVEELEFVIPQGYYKRIDIGFRTFDNNENICLLVLGNYQYSNGDLIPFRFEFTDTEQFKIRAEDDNGNDIILDKDIVSPAKIILNPSYWFQPIPSNDFENATISQVNGINTIQINKNVNDNIYDLILNRIGESATIIFNY